MPSIKVGAYEASIMLIIIMILVASGVTVTIGWFLFATRSKPLVVEEPLSITEYPSTIHIHPGENKTLDIAILNSAYIDYVVTLFTFNESETGINETNWIDDTTLNVKANVLINCGEEIINGSYQLVNDTITLNYIAPECNPENCMDCMCGVVLFYNFTNLHKKNYTFRLVRLGVQ